MDRGRLKDNAAHGVQMTLLLVFGDRGWAWVRFFLSIRPPVLSIRPPVLPVFDAGLVADAGGKKRARRSGCQSEQKRACDPLSGKRGFHTI